jgi:hypothetical protein
VERHRVLEGGDWLFALGEKADCRTKPEECLKLTVKLSEWHSPICEAACQAFGRVHAACAPVWAAEAETKQEKDKEMEKTGGGDYAACEARCRQQGDWRWNMVDCLREVVVEPRELCPKAAELCRNPF